MEYGPYNRVALSAPWREEGSECVEVGETGKKEKQKTPTNQYSSKVWPRGPRYMSLTLPLTPGGHSQ